MLSRQAVRKDPTRAKKINRLSQEQRQEVAHAFKLFDLDRTGRIDYHELKVAMRALGCDVKKADVRRLVEQFDMQGVSRPLRSSANRTAPPPILTTPTHATPSRTT